MIWLAVWVSVHALPATWVCEGTSEELRAGFPWSAVLAGRCDLYIEGLGVVGESEETAEDL